MPKTANTTLTGAKLLDCESDHECTMLTCDMCLVDLPADDAIREEGEDYIAHFCGLDCLEQWHKHSKKQAHQHRQ